jgi:Right handed beta helix region
MRIPTGAILRSVFTLCLVGTAGFTTAGILTVCPSGCTSTTIQGAVTAAIPGDTIQILSSSPHTEGDIFLNKDLVIEGFGISTTIVQAATSSGTASTPVFVVVNGAEVSMTSLTIRNGGATDGGGVQVVDGSLALTGVDVSFNVANSGGGINVEANGSVRLTDSRVFSNTAYNGGGLYVLGSAVITGSQISNNTAEIPFSDPYGGGIYNGGSVVLTGSTVDENYAEIGGGIYHNGTWLYVHTSSITGNTVSGTEREGAGVVLRNSGSVEIRQSTIRLNTGSEAVLSESADILVKDCVISDNLNWPGLRLDPPNQGTVEVLGTTVSGHGASGVVVDGVGAASIVNSTISGNTTSGNGGGILVMAGNLLLASTTITDNTADSDSNGQGNGGGIYILDGAIVTMRNTLIGGNLDLSAFPTPKAPDCAGTVQSEGYNLVQSLGIVLTSCDIQGTTTGNLDGIDPLLGPLADNGGPTPTHTHALDAASPARDAADPAGCTDAGGQPLITDQRHAVRQDRCDIGAFEYGAIPSAIFADGFESGNTNAW